MGRDFGQHGVVVRGDVEARCDAAVDADPGAAGKVEGRDLSRCRQEVFGRIFCVNAAFDGGATRAGVGLAPGEGGAFGDADLLSHKIDPGDHFRHRMLDLQPGVHLDKIKLVIGIDQEFNGASVGVVNRLGHRQGRLGHAVPQDLALGVR